jgi:CPA1 family monovalent cation:H+ antiporter
VTLGLFNIIAVLIVISSLFGYINFRFIKLPPVIGVMTVSLLVSIGLIIVGQFGLDLAREGVFLLQNIDFNKALMVWMLGFLLFAGALQIEINALLDQKWNVLIFSTLGVALSTVFIGTMMYFALGWIGLDMNYIYCLLFGALISPTDPIAVLDLLKRAGAPKEIEASIAGESLFNDGMGVLIFSIIYGIIAGEHAASTGSISLLFAEEALGGAILGLVLGAFVFWLLKSVDNYRVEIMLTLGLVTGGYALASSLETSGPIAMVVAGLVIGNQGKKYAMSDKTRERLTLFWELIDEILNSVLFVLIGMELLAITFKAEYVFAGIAAIPIALISRYASLALPFYTLRLRGLPKGALKIMTWGGLRGGIAVALALAIPQGHERNIILTLTYIVAAFSIIIQSLTMNFVATSKVLHAIHFEMISQRFRGHRKKDDSSQGGDE